MILRRAILENLIMLNEREARRVDEERKRTGWSEHAVQKAPGGMAEFEERIKSTATGKIEAELQLVNDSLFARKMPSAAAAPLPTELSASSPTLASSSTTAVRVSNMRGEALARIERAAPQAMAAVKTRKTGHDRAAAAAAAAAAAVDVPEDPAAESHERGTERKKAPLPTRLDQAASSSSNKAGGKSRDLGVGSSRPLSSTSSTPANGPTAGAENRRSGRDGPQVAITIQDTDEEEYDELEASQEEVDEERK